jgi:hypothetical protein
MLKKMDKQKTDIAIVAGVTVLIMFFNWKVKTVSKENEAYKSKIVFIYDSINVAHKRNTNSLDSLMLVIKKKDYEFKRKSIKNRAIEISDNYEKSKINISTNYTYADSVFASGINRYNPERYDVRRFSRYLSK